ncbi:LysE family translocator [Aestuariirhabdus sp. Z084]|uniref:LysE family translocator n=1 Tax=Aestuariirhabdus haliotis TaxID=2918751 RepID=UPI00201B39F3|nr:LysE family translocator [Aestuariirhabdus haliotis]MCL6417588.1 LysE family translocator [Aestuariirhabdus haliotis]MCL6421508.1 LysE family translocator [Aestuariirhabdus haliotis]
MQMENWLIFCSIALVATVTPGPAILLVSTHSLQFGLGRALMTIAGNVSGLFIMSACSVAGLSALLLASTFAFTVVKILGALYLIYLGIKLWRGGVTSSQLQASATSSPRTLNLYLQGLLVALTNPKAIVFTTALFPQFISSTSSLIPQFTILVLTFMGLSFSCLLAYAVASRRIKNSSARRVNGRWLNRCFGGAFIGAGTLLAFTAQR